MTDIRGRGFADDVALPQWLVREVGIAAVPWRRPGDGWLI
jgi:hypothetical protein